MLTNIFLSLAEVILALTLFIYVFNISLTKNRLKSLNLLNPTPFYIFNTVKNRA